MVSRFNYSRLIWFIFLLTLPFASQTSVNTKGSCPAEPPPVDCSISGQFNPGRTSLNQLMGTYVISGQEVPEIFDGTMTFNVNGNLQVEIVGGSNENYLDINCDGSVTGQGKDKISGSISKSYVSNTSPGCNLSGNQMNWDIEIERTYSITGNVTNTGEMELALNIDTATIDMLSGSNFIHPNYFVLANLNGTSTCYWEGNTASFSGIDVSGYTENIRLTDSNYDPITSSNWNPELEVLDNKSWLTEMGSHLQLNYLSQSGDIDPVLVSTIPSPPIGLNLMFFMDTITADLSADFLADIKTPIITDLKLDEEKYYLLDVDVNTSATVTVDWKDSDEDHQIEFTYGTTTETIAATGDETTWFFDAGEAGVSIKAKAISQSGESSEWEINTNKITVPQWAGVAADWDGISGINYNATLDWPISLQTTRTVNTLSLLTGFWGIDASISSEFNANASSDGSETNGDLMTTANLKLANKQFDFNLEGNNYTTLTCNDLTTNGDATADLLGLNWKKKMTPLAAIPGLQSAACGLSNSLCNLIDSFGIKAEAGLNLSGDATFASDNDEIKWDSGSLTGELYAKVSVKVVPKPLSSLAQVKLEGGGSGCLGFQFAPAFAIEKLGGEVNIGATVSFFGISTSPSHEWPFGDACSTKPQEKSQGTQGWVPADGQLAMAANNEFGAAVWTELPTGQSRPSGDIKLRIWNGVNWGAIQTLTNDIDADMAPSIEFDANGNVVIVYQRSTEAIPVNSNDLEAFANDLELYYIVFNPTNNLITTTGQITSNNENDFGPLIEIDSTNQLHVFWQRANGSAIFGDAIDTVSIHNSSWDPSTQTWSTEETVADDLSYTLGWSAASFTQDKMLISLVLDTDQDFTTNIDREIYYITKDQGVWNNKKRISTNSIDDNSPLSAYNSNGDEIILWRQNDTIMQVQGNLNASPTIAFTSLNPIIDEGIGAEFGYGALVAVENGLITLWSESTQIEMATNIDQAGWSHSGMVQNDEFSQNVHNTFIQSNILNLAYSSREFDTDNKTLSEFITPIFKNIQLPSDLIFVDGFD